MVENEPTQIAAPTSVAPEIVTFDNSGNKIPYVSPPAEALRNEAKLPAGVVEVKLCGETVRILPVQDWFTSANDALSEGSMNRWARLCLYKQYDDEGKVIEDDYKNVWMQLNDGNGPRNSEVNDMFEEWAVITGQGNPGK